ncbi:peptidase C39 family protein [Nocardioides pantholopis]|uniref:peptidase C39 family protein n=1 Tax=Nocardioides pantholopis TaxID=2483798 RepID=UPI0013DE254B|nr:peptidase C39 family protein [Nocardioides pantholopis]
MLPPTAARRRPPHRSQHRSQGRPRPASLAAGLGLALATSVLAALPAAAAPAAPAAAARAGESRVDLARWDSTRQLATGAVRGAKVKRGKVAFAARGGARRLGGTTYDVASWTSRWTAPGLDFTQLIASWEARTPGNSLVEIKVRGRDAAGKRSSWDVLGRWAENDQHVRSTSLGAQADDLARVDVDTWSAAAPAGLRSYQVRVALLRQTRTRAVPSVDAVHVMTSRVPKGGTVATSAPGVARGTVLDVPRFSQMTHAGHYPRWGGGGQAWCSPTSTSMVLGHYGALPRRKAYSWVPAGHPDPVVDHAARRTYDHRYRGTGNWAFNTAYAAPRAGNAFVTRLTSLREAEQLIAAGIPVVASVSFRAGQLTGAPISSTAGHLLVIVGFTADGDVVVNDPAARTRAGVRRTYDRGQFENVWLPTSGGLAYVIHDAEHPLPPSSGSW